MKLKMLFPESVFYLTLCKGLSSCSAHSRVCNANIPFIVKITFHLLECGVSNVHFIFQNVF